jgi:hypothetical protein
MCYTLLRVSLSAGVDNLSTEYPRRPAQWNLIAGRVGIYFSSQPQLIALQHVTAEQDPVVDCG